MKKIILAVSALISSSVFASTQPSLVGVSVDAYVSAYGANRLNAYGLDGPFVVADGNSDAKQFGDSFIINIDASSFEVDFFFTGQFSPDAKLTLADLNFNADAPVVITGLTVDTNLQGVQYTTTDQGVQINLGGIDIDDQKYFAAKFLTGPAPAVPEPSTSALMLVGLAMGAALPLIKRRK